MQRGLSPIRAAILISVLVGAPGLTAAATPPTREANTWDWRHHQPEAAQVHKKEQAAGIAPSKQQQKATTGQVERLYRRLEGLPSS